MPTTLPGSTSSGADEKERFASSKPAKKTTIIQHVSDDKRWVNYQLPFRGQQETTCCKLHIFINPAEFNNVHDSILEALKESLEENDISLFKHRLAEHMAQPGQATRLTHMPYTIFLHNLFEHQINPSVIETNLKRVVALCKRIEEILRTTDAGDEKMLAVCDLPISKHIRFRLATLGGKYVAVPTASLATKEQLQHEGLAEDRYQFLLKNMKDVEENYALVKQQAIRIVQTASQEDRFITNKNEAIRAVEKFLLGLDRTPDDSEILQHLTFVETSATCFVCNIQGKLVFKTPEATLVEGFSVAKKA